MEEIRPFVGAVALWIGISCGLWWLRRRSVRGRQNRQLEQAGRAAAYTDEAQAVFDAIRFPVPLENPPAETNAWLKAETHALLKRVQEHGRFFDKVKTLRVQIQSSPGIDDHGPLSELLNLRRDLWAASEVVLVEDPGSFGATFAEDGAYERFQGEALALLFKRPERTGDDDLIDLRLSLARQEAGRFTVELQEAIAIAREQDRLPTLSEIVAYPQAFFRAIPRALRTAGAFLRAFFGYALDAARAIRRSQTMARGATRLREARENWPQRLSGGFEHVSAAARESTTAIRRHYDFLVAAHDFQAKYERLVRAAPEITERGRQFIARLELAERSERLQLTSANAAIWMARGLLSGLAHLLAGIARLHAALRETAPWTLAAALLRPAPLAGRRRSAFRSYRMALAAGGLSEMPFERHWRLAPLAALPQPARGKTKAKVRAKVTKAAPAPKAKAAPKQRRAAAKPAQAAAPVSAKTAAMAKTETRPIGPSAAAEKPPAAKPNAASGAVHPDQEKAAKTSSQSLFGVFRRRARPAAGTSIEAETPPPAPNRPPKPQAAAVADANHTTPKIESVAAPEAPAPEPPPAILEPLAGDSPMPHDEALARRRPSFLKRLFGKSVPQKADAGRAGPAADQAAGTASPPQSEPASETVPPPPKLMDKLSSLEDAEQRAAEAESAEHELDAADTARPEAEQEEDADDPGPLTLRILDLQAKIKPKEPQIRSFPWLRE
jgi:hypothetical protein